jgi:menaquinone-9 beta-reductase
LPPATYDIVTIGGGIAGATLAKVMSDAGAKVLVIERELQFKDRVRGEGITCWGVTEARALGVHPLIRGCSDELRYWDTWSGAHLDHRDLIETTFQHEPILAFYHPELQEILLRSAETSGTEIRRGATVRGVSQGYPSQVFYTEGAVQKQVTARLIVGADGKTSTARKFFADSSRRDPPRRLIAGVLLENLSSLPTDTVRFQPSPESSSVSLFFPRGDGRARAYLVYPHDSVHRLQGSSDFERFVSESVRAGVPAAVLEGSRIIGPLASFDGADAWVDHPYQQGLVLIGDAAASNDPSFGQGLALTLRDVRVLRDSLLGCDDWDKAGNVYAEQHDHHYGVIREATYLFGCMFYESGPVAEARRAKALPLIAEDPTRAPDHLFSGPDLPLNDSIKRRFFGDD